MSTLPATIPGLVRFCTPLCFRDEETPWVAIGCGPIEGGDPTLLLVTATPRSAFGLAITAGAEDFEVDLADPTGFFHAALWLASKYGASQAMIASFHLEPVEASRKLAGGGRWSRSVWELTADGVPVLTIYDADGLKQSALGTGELNVPGIGSVDRIAALRLAVLAVAGVQG